MEVISIRHNAKVLIGDYRFADKVKNEVLSLLKSCETIPQDHSNVKASIHTEWDWHPDNITFRNLKGFIREEIEKAFKPGRMVDGNRAWLKCSNFWANVYEKGEYANSHDHRTHDFSFAYFVKCNFRSSPLILDDSGKRIRAKEGRFVAFPSFLKHSVPRNQSNETRITLSGNFALIGKGGD